MRGFWGVRDGICVGEGCFELRAVSQQFCCVQARRWGCRLGCVRYRCIDVHNVFNVLVLCGLLDKNGGRALACDHGGSGL